MSLQIKDISPHALIRISSGLAAITTHIASQVWEPPAIVVVGVCLLSIVAGPIIAKSALDLSIYRACLLCLEVGSIYTTILVLSIEFRRLYLHPLSRFPGPTRAALSKLNHMSHYFKGDTPAYVDSLHREYGDVVRIGPNELSVRDASAISSILGYPGKMNKGPWYLGSFTKKGQSVHALRDIHEHAQRRKYWDRAFSGKALQDYQIQIKECTDLFISQLTKLSESGPLNITTWCTFVAFDIMGSLGFGETFGMLETGKAHSYQMFIESAMKALSIFSEIPWIMPVLASLPAGKGQEDIYRFSMETTMRRKHRGSGRVDVFSYLVGEDQGAEKAPMTDFELDADVRTIIIAGSDTTASTLNFIIYELLQHPQWMQKLQQEVEHIRGTDPDIAELAKLPILNAVINETLRYHTIVPSRSQRIVPAGGAVLAGQAVPAGTFVSVPFSAIMHDERYFTRPNEWRPERFIESEKEGNFENKAFVPFSFGPFNCAGRLLAILELRIMVNAFVLAFNGKVVDDAAARAFENSVKDHFTVQKEDLYVTLLPRKLNT